MMPEKIESLLLDLFTRFNEIEKHDMDYGLDIPVHYAEIHAISAIFENNGIHAGGLAELLGINKSSASELIGKLEKKGLLIKDISADNQSKLALRLTGKGKIAHEHHVAYHTALSSFLVEIISNVPEEKLEFLQDFLTQLVDGADRIKIQLQE